ncbi:MAG TPA: hypothetical protein VHL52_05080 [Acidimicrobiia bacterium]|nr:hypothetical protein [Acidimicrobiia bacterium]
MPIVVSILEWAATAAAGRVSPAVTVAVSAVTAGPVSLRTEDIRSSLARNCVLLGLAVVTMAFDSFAVRLTIMSPRRASLRG